MMGIVSIVDNGIMMGMVIMIDICIFCIGIMMDICRVDKSFHFAIF